MPTAEPKRPVAASEAMLMQMSSNKFFVALRRIPERDLLRWWADENDDQKKSLLLAMLGMRNVMR